VSKEGAPASAIAELLGRLRTRSGFSAEAISLERLRAMLVSRAVESRVRGAEEAARAALENPSDYARIEAHFAPPETWLFRYPESFELVRAFAAARNGRVIRALVVGAGGWCEPCSLAAALLEGAPASSITIDAFDRNPLLFPVAPRFAGVHLRGGMPAWAERFFADAGDARSAQPQLSAIIRTSVGEAGESTAALIASGRRFDIVSFRNVAIYLNADVRRAVFRNLSALVDDDGVLLVGHAEMPVAVEMTGFSAHSHAGAFALERAAIAPMSISMSMSMSTPTTTPQTIDPEAYRSIVASASASVGATATPRPPVSPIRAARPLDPIEALRAEIFRMPADAALHVRLAAALDERGDRAAAAESVGKALYLDRFCEEALVLAARFADARGASADAQRYRMRALRVHLEKMHDDDA
jgi:chemotaxis methyl-accepting protein methylase